MVTDKEIVCGNIDNMELRSIVVIFSNVLVYNNCGFTQC